MNRLSNIIDLNYTIKFYNSVDDADGLADVWYFLLDEGMIDRYGRPIKKDGE